MGTSQRKTQEEMFSKAALIAAVAVAGADAFMPGSALPAVMTSRKASMSLRRTIVAQAEDSVPPTPEEEEAKPIATGGTDYTTVKKKEVTPLFLIPSSSVVGSGAMVGDKGFDPLGLASSEAKLKNYREAELKHGRLAMLAAVGWPVAEEVQGPLSKALGMPDLLVKGCATANTAECIEAVSRAPSVLNGGLENISPIYWGAIIAFSAAVENYGQKINKKPNYLPGDLGFDPLNLYQKKTPEQKLDIQLKEVNNGRLAMIAITGYAFNEAATKISVVREIGLPQA